jgi:hypothetical protein
VVVVKLYDESAVSVSASTLVLLMSLATQLVLRKSNPRRTMLKQATQGKR